MVTATMEQALGLGEWAVSRTPDEVLTCLGLGSCVAIAIHDASVPAAGMAHMVLPDSSVGRPSSVSPAKFVDLAVPLLVAAMVKVGAQPSRMRIELVGGASMLEVPGRRNTMQIGDRNVVAARAALAAQGLAPREEHVGGTNGRTVRIHVATGQVDVSTAGQRG